MADGTHDKVKLNVRVPPDKKQEWKDALDEGETLSSFVRRSVDRELRDEYVPRDAVDDLVGTTDQADIDLSLVMTRFDDLQQTVEAPDGKFDTLSASDASVEGEDVEDLAMDLLPRLPSYPHDIPEQALRDAGGRDNLDVREYIEGIVKISRKDSEIQTIDGTAQKITREMREPTRRFVRHSAIWNQTQLKMLKVLSLTGVGTGCEDYEKRKRAVYQFGREPDFARDGRASRTVSG